MAPLSVALDTVTGCDHVLPSQWIARPLYEVANASVGEVAHTPRSVTYAVPSGLGEFVHVEPSQWTMYPPLPTTQTSFGPLPLIAAPSGLVSPRASVQLVPL